MRSLAVVEVVKEVRDYLGHRVNKGSKANKANKGNKARKATALKNVHQENLGLKALQEIVLIVHQDYLDQKDLQEIVLIVHQDCLGHQEKTVLMESMAETGLMDKMESMDKMVLTATALAHHRTEEEIVLVRHPLGIPPLVHFLNFLQSCLQEYQSV